MRTMITNRLSRWTPLFFRLALLNCIGAEALVLAGVTWPACPPGSAGTLIAVHLLVIGWLLLLVLGALFQFVPVITTLPLGGQTAALGCLVAVEGGLLGMIGGFLGVAGVASRLAWLLPAGGGMVTIGISIAIWNLGVPLARARPRSLPGRMVATGLAFLVVTVALGLLFGAVLSAPAAMPEVAPILGGVGEHALAGLGGWFTLTAMGVSYKLLPMFMLAPEERGALGRTVHVVGATGFAVAVLAGLGAIWLPVAVIVDLRRAGDLAIGLAVALYLWDVRRIYAERRRVAIELHNRVAIGAFAFLGAAVALAAIAAAVHRLDGVAPSLVFLVVFGWLGGLGLTQLYKIVPFLAWLLRYGGRLGRGPVPRVQDLVRDRAALPWFIAYEAGVSLAAIAAVLRWPIAFRIAMAPIAIATIGLAVEYWRAWHTTYARPSAATPPAGPATQHASLLINRGDRP
jgi:hypothetical protein